MNDARPTCPCKWCGKQTPMTGTKMCDMCWELDGRVAQDINVTAAMLKAQLSPMELALFIQILREK